MMEIEDINIQAKEAYGKYRDKKYKMKVDLISDLNSSQMIGVNKYDRDWDGLVNSTIIKLEKYLKENYHKELVY